LSFMRHLLTVIHFSLFRLQTFFPVQIFRFFSFVPLTGNAELREVFTRRLFKLRMVWKLQRILTLQGKCGILLYERPLLFFYPKFSAGNRLA